MCTQMSEILNSLRKCEGVEAEGFRLESQGESSEDLLSPSCTLMAAGGF